MNLAGSWLILDFLSYPQADLHYGSMEFGRQKRWGLHPHEKGELFPHLCQRDLDVISPVDCLAALSHPLPQGFLTFILEGLWSRWSTSLSLATSHYSAPRARYLSYWTSFYHGWPRNRDLATELQGSHWRRLLKSLCFPDKRTCITGASFFFPMKVLWWLELKQPSCKHELLSMKMKNRQWRC